MIFGFFRKKQKKATGEKGQKAEVAEVKEEVAGEVSHYFSHAKAAVVKLEGPLNIGDEIHIKGHTSDFKQKITSMQVMGKPITSAKKGDEVGLLVKDKVRASDKVYKIL